MFSLLFSQLRNIHSHTALLESCGWSEERVEMLVLATQSIIAEATEDIGKKNTIKDLKKNITDQLAQSFAEEEISAILSLIDEIVSTSKNITETIKYEC